jgi:threonine dehydrogenase-like Zn-dependent dehydrogenase
MLEGRKVALKNIMTHVLPLSSLQQAFEILTNPRGGAIKVIIKGG